MKLTVMQHADAEDLGVIKEWAADQGIETVTYRPDQGDPIAQLNPADIDAVSYTHLTLPTKLEV